MITLKVDTTKVFAKLDKIKQDIPKTLSNELNRFGLLTVNQAKQLCPVDEGFLRNSISFNQASAQNLSVSIVVAANYSPFIEFGTRKFAASYVASLPSQWQQYAQTFRGNNGGSDSDFIVRITEWVKRKGIAQGKNINQAAYLIAKKILRDGIPAQPFLRPAIDHQFLELKKRLSA